MRVFLQLKRPHETPVPESAALVASVAPKLQPTFHLRDLMEEMTIFYEFLAKGIDTEDIAYFKSSYEKLLSQEALQVYAANHEINYHGRGVPRPWCS